MPPRKEVGLARCFEAFSCVLADRLEHPEPAASVGLDERLLDERLELVEARRALGAHGLDVDEGASAREHGEAAEQSLLRLVEEGVAPLGRCPQRLLPALLLARYRS